ncbi:NifU family protein [Gordonia rhizosphera]|nr:NifU family protein [Gordonia rhizosphera]
MPDRSTHDVDDGRWRAAGDRIETLLDASSVNGAAARDRAEALVREVAELYGAGLERIVALLDPQVTEALVADELLASLLLVHGLHPHDVRTRVESAIDRVRPYLGSHGGDVAVVGVSDGVVRLELSGSCRTCPSSSVTLELAVEEAVRAAAPEVSAIEVVTADRAPSGLIAADSLFDTVHSRSGTRGSWEPVPQVADLESGDVGGFSVGGVPIFVCRLGDDWYAYHDRCPNCGHSLAGVVVEVDGDAPDGTAILSCPTCATRYDAVHAGRGLDGDAHLDPLPLLTRDGSPVIAVPAGAVR